MLRDNSFSWEYGRMVTQDIWKRKKKEEKGKNRKKIQRRI